MLGAPGDIVDFVCLSLLDLDPSSSDPEITVLIKVYYTILYNFTIIAMGMSVMMIASLLLSI